MRTLRPWSVLVFVVTAIGVSLYNLPASWLAVRLAATSGGRVILADGEGTLWSGSAQLAIANGTGVASRLPGRLRWRLGPRLDGLRFRVESAGPGASGQVSGLLGWRSWRLDDGRFELPAQVLSGLGAPFNTLRLGGQLKLRWDRFVWRFGAPGPEALMTMDLDAEALSSRLSPVTPLGHYQLHLAWGPLGGKLDLATISGPLMLSGQGALVRGRLGFDGEATASEAAESQLGGLLGILGKRDGAVTRLHF